MTAEKLKIVKPSFLERFKSRRPATIAGVETLLTALPILRISDAKDFVRVCPEDRWSPELCFVSVPIQGEKRDMLHLIDEEIALQYLPAKRIRRHRLALASKPHDNFFLCTVPSQNLDNSWNETTLKACEKAIAFWVMVSSRKEEGVEGYKIDLARDPDAFPDPKWPSRTLDELVEVTFRNASIETDNHPALCRLIGARQDLA